MKVLDIAFKDLVRSFRSTFAVGMMLIAPLLITGLIYFAFGGLSAGTGRFNLPTLNVVVVNQDRPSQPELKLDLGQGLIDYFHAGAMPEWLNVTTLPDEAAARSAVDRQAAGVAIIVPPDLTDAVLAPDRRATITLVKDPTLNLGPQIVQDLIGIYLDGFTGAKIAITAINAQLKPGGKTLEPAQLQAIAGDYGAWYTQLQQNLHHSNEPVIGVQAPPASTQAATANADILGNLMSKIMAGMLIFFAFYTGAYSAQSILKEDEEGTLPRLFTTPTSRTSILAGKFASIFVLVSVQAIVLMAASSLVFHINWGQPLPVALVVLGLVVVAAGFGLFVMSFVKNSRQSGPVLGGALTVTGMLGGLFTVAVPTMPAAFNTLSQLMPQGWALRGWKLALDGGALNDVLLPAAVMLVLGAAFFAFGAMKFQKRFA